MNDQNALLFPEKSENTFQIPLIIRAEEIQCLHELQHHFKLEDLGEMIHLAIDITHIAMLALETGSYVEISSLTDQTGLCLVKDEHDQSCEPKTFKFRKRETKNAIQVLQPKYKDLKVNLLCDREELKRLTYLRERIRISVKEVPNYCLDICGSISDGLNLGFTVIIEHAPPARSRIIYQLPNGKKRFVTNLDWPI